MVRCREVRALGRGVAEFCLGYCGIAKVGKGEAGMAERCAREIGLLKVADAPLKVDTCQVPERQAPSGEYAAVE